MTQRTKRIPFFNKPIQASLRLLGLKSKVNLVVTGMPKSGTTALHNMLVGHYEFSFSRKEINYFNNDNWFLSSLGDAEYHCHFPLPWNKKKYTVDTSFYMYHPEFHKRIVEYNPNVKIIVILRNPTTRYISDYAMIRKFQEDGKLRGTNLGLLEKIKFDIRTTHENEHHQEERLNPNNILRTGIVDAHIRRLIQHFAQEQLLFIKQEKLKSDHRAVMHTIGQFLSVDLCDISPKRINVAKERKGVDGSFFSEDELAKATKMLDAFYEKHWSRTERLVQQFSSI